MSKHFRRENNLPPLQKRIILCLAEKGAQTINKTKENLTPKGHYKSTYIAFQSLEKKGLIQKQGVKTYRNQEYSTYWLTEEGILSAVLNHASLRRLRLNTRRVHGKTENYEAFFDMVEVVGATKMRGIVELSKQYKTQAQMPDYLVVAPHTLVDNEKQLKAFAQCIKKYPNVKKIYEIKSKRARAKLKKIEEYMRT